MSCGFRMGFCLLLMAGSASAQSVGIYADAQSTSHAIVAPLQTPTVFYVNAVSTDLLDPPGFAAAEFRIVHDIGSAEATWSATANPAASTALGDPLLLGCNIAFSTCQTGASVMLYTVEILVLDEAAMQDRILTIRAHGAPGAPNYQDPLLIRCDAPQYTAFPFEGPMACINDTQGMCGPVAVEAGSWTRVKALYD